MSNSPFFCVRLPLGKLAFQMAAIHRKSRLAPASIYFFAEREGFEPPERRRSTVFKTAVIDHSTTSPYPFIQRDCKYKK